ncbi:hypothetical protein ACIQ7Q_30620 [Streptomyces sp. NPDC096176]|uniref:hypothetical protein n=1 Tax=Streptomyces sp. NPDC096176 TaxID=3366079 RepID=UPI00382D8DDB
MEFVVVKSVRLTVLALLGAVALGCGAADDSGVPAGEAAPQADGPMRYRETPPDDLARGQYKRSHDAADPDVTLAELMAGQVEDPTAVFGAYDPVRENANDISLSVTGVTGTVLSPVTARDELLRILDRRDNDPQALVGPRSITPNGSREPLTCRVTTRTSPDVDFSTLEASCTWADESAVLKVNKVMRSGVDAGDVDLDALAAESSTIRDDLRVN